MKTSQDSIFTASARINKEENAEQFKKHEEGGQSVTGTEENRIIFSLPKPLQCENIEEVMRAE